MGDAVGQAWDRLQPSAPPATSATELLVVAGLALAVVAVPALWQVARLGVTLVHELGHALVGICVGRQFSGFVLRGDASGHAVTRGPRRGPGMVATTAAGYPAPALLAAGLAAAAGRGWSSPVLATLALVLVLVVLRVRSTLTAAVTVGTLAGVGGLWWWGTPELQARVLVGAAAVLLVGAWRHVAASARGRAVGSDAAVLAGLTHVPRPVWLLLFAAACAGSTWSAVTTVADGVG